MEGRPEFVNFPASHFFTIKYISLYSKPFTCSFRVLTSFNEYNCQYLDINCGRMHDYTKTSEHIAYTYILLFEGIEQLGLAKI